MSIKACSILLIYHYVEQKAPFCLVSYERGDKFVQSF